MKSRFLERVMLAREGYVGQSGLCWPGRVMLAREGYVGQESQKGCLLCKQENHGSRCIHLKICKLQLLSR